MLFCRKCGGHEAVKNGHIHTGKQRYLCKNCGYQFVEKPEPYKISADTKSLIDRLLLERIPLAGIARAAQVSETWLQAYVNNKYDSVKKDFSSLDVTAGKIKVECDETWSFVGNKKEKRWIWLAKIKSYA